MNSATLQSTSPILRGSDIAGLIDVECDPEMPVTEIWEGHASGAVLLQWLGRIGADKRRVVLATCACVRLALPHIPPNEHRPRRAIQKVEAWCGGYASAKRVREAAYATLAAIRRVAPNPRAAAAARAARDTALIVYTNFQSTGRIAAAVAVNTEKATQASCAPTIRQHFTTQEVEALTWAALARYTEEALA